MKSDWHKSLFFRTYISTNSSVSPRHTSAYIDFGACVCHAKVDSELETSRVSPSEVSGKGNFFAIASVVYVCVCVILAGETLRKSTVF